MLRRPDRTDLVAAGIGDATRAAAPSRDVIELETRLQRRLNALA